MLKKMWNGKYKWIVRIAALLCLLGVLGLIAVLTISYVVIQKEKGQIFESADGVREQADCILVLGAGLTPDGAPSRVLTERLEKGIELYRAGVSDRLLMSGDHGREGYDEVKAMKKYAIEAGIPADHIFMDHAGFSTYESIYRARDVFQVKKMVVVTQQYHTYRALYIADKLGVEACGVPAVMPVYRGNWMLEVREKVARAKEFFNVMIQPKPTYLGDVIPISGSGDETDDEKEVFGDSVSEKTENEAAHETYENMLSDEKNDPDKLFLYLDHYVDRAYYDVNGDGVDELFILSYLDSVYQYTDSGVKMIYAGKDGHYTIYPEQGILCFTGGRMGNYFSEYIRVSEDGCEQIARKEWEENPDEKQSKLIVENQKYLIEGQVVSEKEFAEYKKTITSGEKVKWPKDLEWEKIQTYNIEE